MNKTTDTLITAAVTDTYRKIYATFRAYRTPKQIEAMGLEWITTDIERYVQCEELPSHVDQGAYGVSWARNTGRLPGVVEIAIRGLVGKAAIRLIADTADACATSAEVPAYLIRRHCAA